MPPQDDERLKPDPRPHTKDLREHDHLWVHTQRDEDIDRLCTCRLAFVGFLVTADGNHRHENEDECEGDLAQRDNLSILEVHNDDQGDLANEVGEVII